MSLRRRRLWGLVLLSAGIWGAVATAVAPAASATIVHPAPAATVAESSSALRDLVTLRPFTVLRDPGETGLVIAHRGDSDEAPENTIPAFASTSAAGASHLELDIRLSADGIPMVIHDATVDRTTDGTGAVGEMTAHELRALDAGSWFSEEFRATRIPTLAEALAQAATQGQDVLIEYKGAWKRSDIRTTMRLIADAGLERRVIAQSFSRRTVANIAAVAPDMPLGWLTHELDALAVHTALSIGADAVNPAAATIESVALAHRAGLGVFVWTHDEDAAWEAYTQMGVDGIITNRPRALVAWSEA
ncbi:glycerophosphodiester phosphodiesterase family protein [uncultured Microbacterium sp.]|uniref:glycerophosphodiester phosphodiesterase n=1 Tax=uncultured Microbacterium sp. TaxID=191216 RepID=UPI0026117DBD|nr:glycerophosphodiester phosphodiesterase family protein [uncultured Microbacterium sp.]